jgi:uncharacterized protein (PEP-CTERM system associated)
MRMGICAAPLVVACAPTPLAPLPVLTLTAAALWVLPCQAGEWQPGLRLNGRATLTDNYNLAPSGQEKADLVLSVAPAMSLSREGDRASVFLDYTPTLHAYTTHWSQNYVSHRLNALASLEAVENFFFVDAFAYARPSFVSPFLPGTDEDVGLTDNRIQNWSLGLSPYIRGVLGDGYRYLVRNDNIWTATDASALPKQYEMRWHAQLDSPFAGRRYGWTADYRYRSFDSQSGPSYYEQQARLIGRYRVDPDLAVNVRGGYETNDYAVGSYSGPIYGAGLDWTPTPRTLVSGFAEHRFFGTGYEANLSHRTRITSWRLRGSRNTRTYHDLVFGLPLGDTRELLDATFQSRIPDPIEREQAVEDFIQRSGLPATLSDPLSFYNNRVVVTNAVDATAGLFGVRNALTFTLFYRKNDPVTAAGQQLPSFLLNNNAELEQRGAILAASHNLSARTAISASVRRTYSVSSPTTFGGQEIDSTQDVVRVTISDQINPRTGAAAGVRWINFDSEVPSSSYQEHAVYVAISHRFF